MIILCLLLEINKYMKNEIELKEELLVLEAKYIDIVNSGESSRYKYWYQKEHKLKSKEICHAMINCRREIEILSQLKKMEDELNSLKSLKQTMKDLMENTTYIPSTYLLHYNDLIAQICSIEGKIKELSQKSI